jgi:methylmalonyl-CoA/ethylmalonyl-CoA epimerase
MSYSIILKKQEAEQMGNGVLGTNIVTQIGFIVKDINETKKKFAEFLGLPEPEYIVTEDIEKTQAEYNGQPCPAKAKLAFLKVGDSLDIELIEPDEKPSVWREFLETNGEGVQHIAFVIKDTKQKIAELDKIGMKLVQKGEYTGGRYSYIDTLKDLKVMVELLEND